MIAFKQLMRKFNEFAQISGDETHLLGFLKWLRETKTVARTTATTQEHLSSQSKGRIPWMVK
jgi:hypothetical protein